MALNKHKPAIVVAAFSRIRSLKRLLFSLNRAHYDTDTTLVISIDNNGSNQNVADYADEFEWKHGDKQVIYHPERLGLRNHIIKCGDLTYKFGSIIMLEDDLFVSPVFYEYTLAALDRYDGDKHIAGIALYSLPYSEASKLPFQPHDDDSDVYFKQMPASHGQSWTKEQWDGFRQWYNTKPDPHEIDGMPDSIQQWSPASWKRFFVAYMVKFNKFFVFPRIGYTTTFPDPGTHLITRSYTMQVPLKLKKSPVIFKDLHEASNVYDVYSELLPDRLKRLNPAFSDYDFEMDLYGWKEKYIKPWVVTSRPCRNPAMQFDRNMKPIEMNLIMNLEGDYLFLARSEDVIRNPKEVKDFIEEQTYWYRPIYRTAILLKILRHRFKNKLKGKN